MLAVAKSDLVRVFWHDSTREKKKKKKSRSPISFTNPHLSAKSLGL